MAFVDEARIFLKAGDGGKGCESYYSDKFTRHPKPDGGDGGRGGNIVFVADSRMQTLLDYRFKQHYKAKKGGNGGSRKKKGKTGDDCILRVPVGTILRDKDTNLLIKDLTLAGQSVIVVKGGGGGIGNSQKRRTIPHQLGEERVVHLELKIIADVGIVGFPNVGKSTLVSNISKVRSKIASYPFTTKQPILGIVKGEDFDFAVADLPGLIEGAHSGRGLGDRFLKHAERTKILLHMVDVSGSEGRDPCEDYEKINLELEKYSEKLLFKHKIVAANKVDLPGAEDNLKRFKKRFKEKVFSISALNNLGLEELVEKMREVLWQENFQEKSEG